MTDKVMVPSLFLRRLVVVSEGHKVYDEHFHVGLNIIRGFNGTGKTTIADFIFYGLGGESINWKDEAIMCDYVFCEIFVSGRVWTTRREIRREGKVGTDVYEGAFDDIGAQEKWRHYPFSRRAGEKDSYSQLLFSCLGIPDVSVEDENMTVHKILRALYIDQTSPMHSLLYSDVWDSAIIREMIGNVLFGVYSPELFDALRNIRKFTGEKELKEREIKGLNRSYTEAGFILDAEAVRAKIKAIDTNSANVDGVEVGGEDDYLENKISKLNENLSYNLERLSSVKFEFDDSILFISALEKKLKQIDQSIAAKNYIGHLKIDTCPICLSSLSDENSDGAHCYLCHNEVSKIEMHSSLVRMREEVQFQLKESNKIQGLRGEEIVKLKEVVGEIRSDLAVLKNLLKDKVSIRAGVDSNLGLSAIIKKAEKIAERKELEKNLRLITRVDDLKEELSAIIKELHRNQEVRFQVESNQKRKKELVLHSIDALVRALLRADPRYEHEFTAFGSVEVDFPRNTFALDGKNNFSASSVVYLKNSILFAMFFSSLEHEFMCYPRFILCDNTEDKGMQPERSQAFQRKILEISKKHSDTRHQIIMTTSMIAEDLNTADLCIGEFFTNENMSLQFSGSLAGSAGDVPTES